MNPPNQTTSPAPAPSHPSIKTRRSSNGKIARLPDKLRNQINHRLLNGQTAAEILAWLNALPHVKKILAAQFKSEPVKPQNLNNWRATGYQDWLKERQLQARLEKTAKFASKMTNVANDSLARGAAAIVSCQLVEFLESPQQRSIEDFIKITAALNPLLKAEQTNVRLKHEKERIRQRDEQLLIMRDKHQRDDAAHSLRLLADQRAIAIEKAPCDYWIKIELFGRHHFGDLWERRPLPGEPGYSGPPEYDQDGNDLYHSSRRQTVPTDLPIDPQNPTPSRDVSNHLPTIPPPCPESFRGPAGEGRGEGELRATNPSLKTQNPTPDPIPNRKSEIANRKSSEPSSLSPESYNETTPQTPPNPNKPKQGQTSLSHNRPPTDSPIDPPNPIPSSDVSNHLPMIPPIPAGEGRGEGDSHEISRCPVHGESELNTDQKLPVQSADLKPETDEANSSLKLQNPTPDPIPNPKSEIPNRKFISDYEKALLEGKSRLEALYIQFSPASPEERERNIRQSEALRKAAAEAEAFPPFAKVPPEDASNPLEIPHSSDYRRAHIPYNWQGHAPRDSWKVQG